MALENTSADFAERLHTGLLHQDRADWRALLQTRHKEHLRLAREIHRIRLQLLFQGLLQGLLQVLSAGVSQGFLQGFPGASTMQLCLVDAPLPANSPAKPILLRPFAFPLALLREAFDKGRDTLQGPRRHALSDGSLEKALGESCDHLSPHSAPRVQIVILGESRPLPARVHDQVYWIAREALRNALRHSAASRVDVEIEYWAHKLRVVVRDDGAGIEAKALRTRTNHGLTVMQERAATINAKLRVSSKQGGGTEVEISLPILKEHTV